jgi:hypothetical protein
MEFSVVARRLLQHDEDFVAPGHGFCGNSKEKADSSGKDRLRNDNGRVLPRSDLAATMQRKGTTRESGAGFFKCARGDENKNGDSQSESPSGEAAEGGGCAAMAGLNFYQPHRP